ncbi:MAG TPA: hypothetical protein VIW46_00080 [Acidimicrobiia bacterium]
MEEYSDADLLAAGGQGNGDAFGVLFRRHVRPITGGETASVTIGSTPDTPGYLAQYGVSIDAETAVAEARNNGYEVSVRRMFTPDPSEDGRILDERRPGPATVRAERGPVLFVIGYTIGICDTNAN